MTDRKKEQETNSSDGNLIRRDLISADGVVGIDGNDEQLGRLTIGDKDRLLILYGGETGNSEDLAKRIYWDGQRRQLDVEVRSLDSYHVGELVNEKMVLFICSTTGQGDRPSNMAKFWQFIMRKHLPRNALTDTHCAVIGLGDSSYKNYNVIGKKLYKRLQHLGGRMLMPLGLGDDQHELGLDATIDPWLVNFWQKAEEMYGIGRRKHVDMTLPKPTYSVKFVNDGTATSNNGVKSKDDPVTCKVLSNERVTAENHFQDVRLIRIHTGDEVTYEPGDVAVIRPHNLDEDIEQFKNIFNLDSAKLFTLTRVDDKLMLDALYDNIPNPCSIGELLTEYLDLHLCPKRSFFELLSNFSDDPVEREKLQEFASTNGQSELYMYCYRPKRTLVEVLCDFPKSASKVPFEYIFNLIPCIKTRSFSIASAQSACPKELHLLVAIVEYQTILKKKRVGLCSTYLSQLTSGSKISISISKGFISLPRDQFPLIMVGPGTGVAPFRSFIQDRARRNVGQNYLFFGCRNESGDFYFRNEWIDYSGRNLLEYYTAFSRDSDQKVYVQQRLAANKNLVWDVLMKHSGYIFIAGSSRNMPQDVRSAIIDILVDVGGQEVGNKIVHIVGKLEKHGRIKYECWS